MLEYAGNIVLRALAAFLGIGDRLSRMRKEDRIKAAEYLMEVSSCILKVAGEVRLGHAPHQACSHLYRYAKHLPEPVERALGQESKDVLQRVQRGHVTRLSLKLVMLSEDRAPHRELLDMEIIGAKLRALAVQMKGS
jgi:hypothetical protein